MDIAGTKAGRSARPLYFQQSNPIPFLPLIHTASEKMDSMRLEQFRQEIDGKWNEYLKRAGGG